MKTVSSVKVPEYELNTIQFTLEKVQKKRVAVIEF